jgi:glycerate 2-kinase
VAASDVDNPLLGLRGASNVFGAQKGASPGDVQRLDAALTAFAERTDRQLADGKGAGAAGGLGFGLALLGATRVPGIATVLDLVGFDSLVRAADVVVTGEGSFDYQSLQGKVVNGVAEAATRHARPTVVLAGRIEVGRREMAAVGVESAYSVVDLTGSVEAALDRPAERLAELAARVARTWSRR